MRVDAFMIIFSRYRPARYVKRRKMFSAFVKTKVSLALYDTSIIKKGYSLKFPSKVVYEKNVNANPKSKIAVIVIAIGFFFKLAMSPYIMSVLEARFLFFMHGIKNETR